MQVKGVRKLVKKLKRGIRHMYHIGPHSHSAPDAAFTSAVVRDLPVLPITLSLSPKTKASCDSMTSSMQQSGSEDAPLRDVGAQSSLTTATDGAGSSTYVSAASEVNDMLSESSEAESHSLQDGPASAPELVQDDPVAGLPAESALPDPPPADMGERTSTLDDSNFDSSETEARAQEVLGKSHLDDEVPDPFLVDEGEDTHSEEQDQSEEQDETEDAPIGLSVDTTQQSLAQADEVSLAQAPSVSTPSPSDPLQTPAPDLNKSVPSLPAHTASEDEEDEEEVPELYLPGLTLPTMFLPIPNVRSPLFHSLTWWLSRSVIYYPCTIRRTL